VAVRPLFLPPISGTQLEGNVSSGWKLRSLHKQRKLRPAQMKGHAETRSKSSTPYESPDVPTASISGEVFFKVGMPGEYAQEPEGEPNLADAFGEYLHDPGR